MNNKPKIGQPCNGCGLCCMTQTCMNGAYIMGLVDTLGEYVEGQCPALKRMPHGTYVCDILLNPNKYIKNKDYPAKIKAKHFGFLIGAGEGCDNLYDNDTTEEEEKLASIIQNKKNDKNWLEKAERAMRIIHDM